MDRSASAEISSAVVRFGVGIVFLIFGIWQWVSPQSWFGYLPSSIPFGTGQITAIHLNGILDVVIGLLLLLGLFTRAIAIIAAIDLASIIYTIGWNDVAVRDIGLAIIAIGIAINGADRWSLDRRMGKRKASEKKG